jgi:5-formyltetrahydrofolate cyclo-ligase
MADDKEYLRSLLRACRDGLGGSQARATSLQIQSRLLSFDPFQSTPTVVLYAPKDGEVGTHATFDAAAQASKRILFPRVDRGGRRLDLAVVTDLRALAPGAFGVLEPSSDAPRVDPAHLGAAVVLVPGLAFTVNGQRLGRGGGYYDRLLAELDRQAISVGLAYSFQLLDRIPETASDRGVDYIITEFAVHGARADARYARRTAVQGGTARWTQ